MALAARMALAITALTVPPEIMRHKAMAGPAAVATLTILRGARMARNFLGRLLAVPAGAGLEAAEAVCASLMEVLARMVAATALGGEQVRVGGALGLAATAAMASKG